MINRSEKSHARRRNSITVVLALIAVCGCIASQNDPPDIKKRPVQEKTIAFDTQVSEWWSELEPKEAGFGSNNRAVYEIDAETEPEAVQRVLDLATRKELVDALNWMGNQGLQVNEHLSERLVAKQRVHLAGKYIKGKTGWLVRENKSDGTKLTRYRVEVKRVIDEKARNQIVASNVNEYPSDFLVDYDPVRHAENMNRAMVRAGVDPTEVLVYVNIHEKKVDSFVAEMSKWIKKNLRIVKNPFIKKNLTLREEDGLPDQDSLEYVSVVLEVRHMITKGEKRPELFLVDRNPELFIVDDNGDRAGVRKVKWKREEAVDSHRVRLVGEVTATRRNPAQKPFDEQKLYFKEGVERNDFKKKYSISYGKYTPIKECFPIAIVTYNQSGVREWLASLKNKEFQLDDGPNWIPQSGEYLTLDVQTDGDGPVSFTISGWNADEDILRALEDNESEDLSSRAIGLDEDEFEELWIRDRLTERRSEFLKEMSAGKVFRSSCSTVAPDDIKESAPDTALFFQIFRVQTSDSIRGYLVSVELGSTRFVLIVDETNKNRTKVIAAIKREDGPSLAHSTGSK